MSVTTRDRKTALIVIDLQKGIAQLAGQEATARPVRHSRILAQAFRSKRRPLVLVNIAGRTAGRTEHPPLSQAFSADWTDLLPEPNQQPEDVLVTKHSWRAFASTDLEQRMRGAGVTQVVPTAVARSIGVQSSEPEACEAGFNVTLATDAMADLRPEAHHHCSTTDLFPRLGETGTIEEILAVLDRS